MSAINLYDFYDINCNNNAADLVWIEFLGMLTTEIFGDVLNVKKSIKFNFVVVEHEPGMMAERKSSNLWRRMWFDKWIMNPLGVENNNNQYHHTWSAIPCEKLRWMIYEMWNMFQHSLKMSSNINFNHTKACNTSCHNTIILLVIICNWFIGSINVCFIYSPQPIWLSKKHIDQCELDNIKAIQINGLMLNNIGRTNVTVRNCMFNVHTHKMCVYVEMT